MLGLWAKMLHIQVLCPVLLIAGVQTLTIDSQLGTSIEDCFERISIGEQLPLSAIYRNVSELTTRECEQICKQDKQCQAYDYGVGAKGNATCDLSTLNEKEVKDKSPLTRHPDFDIYVRRFQCEQSPPSPIQTLLDDPESERPKRPTDRPQHKPVFRPDVDERPLSDDYLVSSDLNPYNSQFRPDDVLNRPNYDAGPSYGDHRPQDIPFPGQEPYKPQGLYRPDYRPIRPGGVIDSYYPNKPNQYPYRPDKPQDPYRPGRPQDPYRPDKPQDSHRPEIPQDPYRPERPQDPYRPERPQDPYRPDRPQPLPVKPKPDPNDVLQFDDYEKPGYLDKPDPYRPDNYITGPNHKPRPQYKPSDPYGPPIGPPHKPMYSYDSQYASNYGQNDNSVYVEIHDPPRPYVPIKNRPGQNYEHGFLGYGTYSSQNSHAQSSYTGSITEIEHDSPQKPVQKPQEDERPGYGKPDNPIHPNKGSYPQNDYQGYGYNNNRPNLQDPGYQRPNHNPIGNQNYHGSQNSYGNHDLYESSHSYQYGSDHSGSHRPSHGYGGSGYQRPQKPLYDKPSDGDKGDYGNQGSHGGQGSYGGNLPQKPLYDKPSYGDKGEYGNQGSYGGQSSYGGNLGSYGGNQGSYGGSQGSHGGNLGSYGGNQGTYGGSQNSYGGSQGSYLSDHGHNAQGSYGSSHGSFGQEAFDSQNGYGSQSYGQASYGFNQGIYGGNQGIYDSYNSGYGSHSNHGYGNRPIFDYELHKPGYGIEKPEHGRPKPGQKPLYDKPKPGYGDERPDPAYDSRPDSEYQNPGYGNDRPSHSNNKPSYSIIKPSYNNDKPSYANDKPSYDNDRPSYGSNRPSYANDKPSYNNDKPSYANDKPIYGNDKPSYSHDKPSYGNDKPSYGNDAQRPGYGASKPSYTQKPNYEDDNLQDSGYRPANSSFKPDVKPVYEYDMDKPTNVPTYIARPGGDVVTSRPVVIGDYEHPVYKNPTMSHAACFRRVLAGRRALRSFVRKVVSCERLEDCRWECALEKRFHCESFNYRLDQSFRGKGLCELMTKPIEAFDQQRDFVDDKNYDFYEVDRNSLEPNCPETLRGPGLLHSGFLSSKPDFDDSSSGYQNRVENRPNRVDGGWKDRNWVGGYRDRFSFDRNRGGNRRFEDHYVPYQIGQSRTEDHDNWGQYGGNYGGHNYYKDRNEYHKSIDHWGLSTDRPTGVKPHFDRQSHGFDYHSLGKNLDFPLSSKDFHHFEGQNIKSTTLYGYGSWKRGQWNSGSNALDFEDPAAVRSDNFDPQEDHEKGGNDCYSRRRPGMSLKSGAIRRSLTSRNVVECEAACFEEREFKCVSYSYRYSTSRGSDNCFLSERPYRGLEMSADSGSDVYGMPQDKTCAVSSRPWVESECFWHVRSDTAVTGGAVKTTLTVAGLGACEAECIRAQGFFCRGFSFRFDSPTIGDEDIHNCILTSSPTTTLARTDTPGHELYARGNFGRGCEPAVYDDTQNGECYLQYDKAAKLSGAAIRGQARVRDEQTCGVACTEAPFRCLSFSYNNNAPPSSDNCFLSEIRLFDLKRGVDYVHSVDDWLFAFDLFNSKCWRKVHKEDTSSDLPHPIIPSEEFHSSGPSGPPSDPYSDLSPAHPYVPESSSGPSDLNAPSEPSGPTYKPASEYRPYHEIPDKLYPIDDPTGPNGPDKSYPINPYKPQPDRPSFTPPHLKDPNFRPLEVIIPHKPLYLDPEPYGPVFEPDSLSYRPDSPSYRPDTPSYRPDSPISRPDSPSYRPDSPSYRPNSPSYRPDSPISRPDSPSYRPDSPISRPDSPSYKPDRPFRPTAVYPDPGLKPGFGADRPKPVDRPGYERPGQRPQPPLVLGDRESGPIETSWRHYTVSGFPCRAGTTCAQNQIVGHWACEPEGGEIGSWDYCCAPTHRCGYSEGFHKPWCYVGHKQDQWRPCSEKYYPYHQHNVPHPSQGQRDEQRPHRPWRETPPNRTPIRNSPWPVKAVTPPPPDYIPHWDKPPGPYISEADRKYWDDLYEDGPKAYYDKYGNPLPGYSRVPTENRPYIRYKTNDHGPSSGHWIPVSDDRPPVPGLGAARYWPVAYLHRGPPPNITYFRYNETKPTERPKHDTTTTRSRDGPEARDVGDDDGQIIDDRTRAIDKNNDDSNDDKDRNGKRDELEKTRDEKKINDSKNDGVFNVNVDKDSNKSITKADKEEKVNNSDVELVKIDNMKTMDSIKGIDDKLEDFSKSIEVLDIEDAKSDKLSDLKTLEAEERQIEAIGRLLANRRGSKLVIEKRSQKDLDAKNIAVDQDVIDFNFGNRFPTSERRGVIKRISKDEIERDRHIDKSLEVSETTFVRPPRVLSTTESIRKMIVNGKVFYDATFREQEISNATRKAKSLGRNSNATPSVINNSNYGKKKNIRTRNTNPVRRVKRVYRKRYNPGEVRRRLLERDRSKVNTEPITA